MIKLMSLVITLLGNTIMFSGCNENNGGGNKSNSAASKVSKEEIHVEGKSDKGFQLIFEENFDKNLSKWNIWEGGAFNEEIQLYRSEQLAVHGGILTIKTKRQDISGPKTPFDNTTKEFSYVSGRIESKQHFGPKNIEGERVYKIATRMKLPKGLGMWPAFWLFADPWPTFGEIDILEARGNEQNSFQSNLFYGPNPGQNVLQESFTKKVYKGSKDLTDNFHVFELIWEQDRLEILLDGKRVIRYKADFKNKIDKMFGGDMKIVLNTAVGGMFFPNTNVNEYIDEAEMQVDWVKVYKK